MSHKIHNQLMRNNREREEKITRGQKINFRRMNQKQRFKNTIRRHKNLQKLEKEYKKLGRCNNKA